MNKQHIEPSNRKYKYSEKPNRKSKLQWTRTVFNINNSSKGTDKWITMGRQEYKYIQCK